MCGCKKKKGGQLRKRNTIANSWAQAQRKLSAMHKKGQGMKRRRKRKKKSLPLWADALPVRQPRSARPRKHPPMCIKHSKATAGVYIRGNTTKRKPRMRLKTIGARRGKKRGAQWIDDDYLANMPVKGGKYRKQGGPKYAFLS